jgi:hypothetical protein
VNARAGTGESPRSGARQRKSAERAPVEFVREARAVAVHRRRVIPALLGVTIGGALYALFVYVTWWAAAVLLAAVAVLGCAYCSWTFTEWSARRSFRRRMRAAGWCWFCHGGHSARRCPLRAAR